MPYPHKPIKRNNCWFEIILLCSFIGYLCYNFMIGYFSLSICLRAAETISIMYIILWILQIIKEMTVGSLKYKNFPNLIVKCVKLQIIDNLLMVIITCTISIHYVFFMEKDKMDLFFGKPDSIIDMRILFIVMAIYFKLLEGPLTDSYRLERSHSFSGGAAMAYGYYYGYLKIILPGLEEKIYKFLSTQGLQNERVPEKKLFVLIPSSTFIFDKLRKAREDIEALEERLEAHTQDRGMVLNRVYKNTLYEIKDQKDPTKNYYVPLEGATPLKTFKEICDREPQFKAYKQEVISSFYYTLEDLLSKDRDIRDLVELIYYDDEKEPEIEISDVVKQRMKYLEKLKAKRKKV